MNELNVDLYETWEKHAPFMYDKLVVYTLEWPALSIETLPNSIMDGNYQKHSFFLSYQTTEENSYMARSPVKVPTDKYISELESSNKNLNNQMIVKKFDNLDLAMPVDCKIPTENEVNKLKQFSGNPDLLLAKYNNVDIYNWTQYDSYGACHSSKNLVCTLDCSVEEGWGLNMSYLSHQVFTSSGKAVYIFDLQGASLDTASVVSPVRTVTAHTNQVNDVMCSRHSPHIFVSVSDDKTLVVHDLRSEDKFSINFAEYGELNELNGVDNSFFEENLWLVASGNNSVYSLDLRNPKPLYEFRYHTDKVGGCKFNPNSKTEFLSYGVDSRILLWDMNLIGSECSEEDLKEGPPEMTFNHCGHTNSVNDASWVPNEKGHSVASISYDNTFMFWRVNEEVLRIDYEDITMGENLQTSVNKLLN